MGLFNKAIDAVKSGKCSVKWAAEDYKVPNNLAELNFGSK